MFNKIIKTIQIKSLLLILPALALFENISSAEEIVRLPISIVQDSEDKGSIELLLVDRMGYLNSKDVKNIFSAALTIDDKMRDIHFRWLETRAAKFSVGDEYTEIEGIRRKMMKTPLILDEIIYIPLEAVITRAFQSASGASVKWSFPHRTLWVSYKGNITDARNYTYDNYSRLVIELSGPLEHTYNYRRGRFSLNIKEGRLIAPIVAEDVSDPLISQLRINQRSDSLEFLIDLSDDAGRVELMELPSPPRIVLDIENKRTPAPSAEALPPAPAGPALRGKESIRELELIVIDPGHGGRDPGAIGPRGVREKDVVLGISQKLAEKIRERLKIRAVLTRTHDTFIPLADRTKIANDRGADLFISIHANASMNPDSNGFEVFFLAEEASDREAAAVAKLENSVLAMEETPLPDDRVSRILWSLTMNQFMNESSELCSFIQSSVVQKTGLTCRGVKQAGFYVLRGARMPAILVEAGFISNRREEALLNSEEFQEKIAAAICDAIEEYRDWISRK